MVVGRAKTISRTAVEEESENKGGIFRSHNYRETMGHRRTQGGDRLTEIR